MLIHNVIEDKEQSWEVDPVRGVVRVEKSIVRASDTHTISHGGKIYKVDKKTGAFDVPPEVGRFYLGRPGWFDGPGIPIAPTPEELEAVSTGKGGSSSKEENAKAEKA